MLSLSAVSCHNIYVYVLDGVIPMHQLLAVWAAPCIVHKWFVLQVRRMHFHDFMLDVHSRLRSTSGEADPLKRVADDVASGVKVRAWVCCWLCHSSAAVPLCRCWCLHAQPTVVRWPAPASFACWHCLLGVLGWFGVAYLVQKTQHMASTLNCCS